MPCAAPSSVWTCCRMGSRRPCARGSPTWRRCSERRSSSVTTPIRSRPQRMPRGCGTKSAPLTWGATRKRGWEIITPALAADADGSLAAIGVRPAQAVVDCQELLRLMRERQPTAAASAQLATIHRRYLGATKPRTGTTMSLAYRLRLFSLDRWNLGDALTATGPGSAWTASAWTAPTMPASAPSAGGSRSAPGPCAAISVPPRSSTSVGSSPPWAMPSVAQASPWPRSSPESRGEGGTLPSLPQQP